jgi:hypothetical protein
MSPVGSVFRFSVFYFPPVHAYPDLLYCFLIRLDEDELRLSKGKKRREKKNIANRLSSTLVVNKISQEK